MSFSEFYQRSINEPEQFWAEQARRIDWQTPFTQTLDHSNPPFARWFCEGRTNLCHNAIDRWLEKQPEALALIAVSSETEEERTFTFRQLHDEVNAVALATSMDTIFGGKAGGVFFCASDIGWVVGHSYIVYAPLLAGMATIVYEGLPTFPDCGVWWKIVEKYQVSRMFSAPTAIRVLKKFPTAEIRKHDLSSLEVLYLAGEPLDEPTASWVSNTLDVPVIDNYWQTESGWPIMAIARGLDDRPTRPGSPGVPMYGYNVQLLNEVTGEPCGVNEKGMLVVEGPLPPGCIQTIWGDDERFVKTYWSLFPRPVYATFDWGIRDADGYHFILGRTDDVINVAGHRLGTREIEESISSHPGVAEVAVVGVKDALKGQVAVAFVIPKESDSLEDREVAHSQEKAIMALVDSQIGNFGRPAHVWFVSQLPKTRSGKMLRRTIQAICEGRDPGDLTTIDDPSSLDQIRQAMEE